MPFHGQCLNLGRAAEKKANFPFPLSSEGTTDLKDAIRGPLSSPPCAHLWTEIRMKWADRPWL